jgi:hypothetical protein
MKEFTKQEKAAALEKFEEYLFHMDDVLEAFEEQAAQHGFELDYSLDSLDLVEQFAHKLEAKPGSKFADHAAQYLGSVLVEGFGGHWELSLDAKDNSLYYGLPVIVGHTDVDGLQFCPQHIMGLYLARPAKSQLKNAVLADVGDDDFDLDDLPTERG